MAAATVLPQLGGQYLPFGAPPREAKEPEQFDEFKGEIIVADLRDAVEGRGGGLEAFPGEHRLKELLKQPRIVGFDLEWRPERGKGFSNPIALIQIATEDWALLLRTHRSHRWLPDVVADVIKSNAVKKAAVGYDGCDRKKMDQSFGIKAGGIEDVALAAKRKGLEKLGLKSLTRHFGLNIRKDSCMACSDWECHRLGPGQLQYAAEDAFFTLKLWALVEQLPDVVPPEGHSGSSASAAPPGAPLCVPELRPGWEQRGITRRSDGLWCELCGKGPILTIEVMERHLESKQHQKKEAAAGANSADPETAIEIPESLLARGIRHSGDGSGDIICALCSAGPFLNLEAAKVHVRGKLHVKKETARAPLEVPPELSEAGIVLGEDDDGMFLTCSVCGSGRFIDVETAKKHVEGKPHRRKVAEKEAAAKASGEEGPSRPKKVPVAGLTEEDLAGLPGYVQLLEDGQAYCALCGAKANSLRNLFQHLDSERHAKACRKWGEREIVYVPERERFEELCSGRPVRRTAWVYTQETPGAEAPPARSSSSGWGSDNGRRRRSSVSQPAPSQWLEDVAAEAQGGGDEAAERMAEEAPVDTGRRRMVRFAGTDGDEEEGEDVSAREAGPPALGGAWLEGAAEGDAAPACSADSGACTDTGGTASASADAASAGRASSAGGARLTVRALRRVVGAGDGAGSSGEDDGSTVLSLEAGDVVIVEAQDPTGAYYWGRLADSASGIERCGWLVASDVEAIVVGADGVESSTALSPGALVAVRSAVSAPDGWAATNFLVLAVGDVLRVAHVEDDWLWAETASGCAGWAPVSAVEACAS